MAQPSLSDTATAAQSASSSTSPGPGLRQQMRTIVSLYETLTTIYFLLIEQGASTSTAATRASLTVQLNKLRSVVDGEAPQKGAGAAATAERRARPARQQQQQETSASSRRPATGLLTNLRAEHAQRIQRLTVIERVLTAARSRGGSISSSSLPTIAEVSEAIHTLDSLLVGLMQRARRHAQQQATIRRLMHDVQAYDEGMVHSIRRIAVLRDRCDRLVKLGREEEEAMQLATDAPLAYDDILRYARTLSQTTTAPPGFKLKMPLDEGGASHDEGVVEAGVGDGDGEKQSKARKPRLLAENDAADDGEGGNASGGGGGGGSGRGDIIAAIPPHLQDKLPFPSADAMRRGAGEVRTPTWAMFQRGMLHADDGGAGQDEENGAEDTMQERMGSGAGLAMDLDRTAAAHNVIHRPAAAPRPPPVDDEEDGFGLDLN